MMDTIDIAQQREEENRQDALETAQRRAHDIAPGVPGDCDLCGFWSGRLLAGVCAPCRDRYHLP